MTNTDQKTIALVNEFAGVLFLNNLSDDILNSVRDNPVDYIKANADIDIGFDIKITENSSNEVNLVLPYYSAVEAISAEALSYEELSEIDGGEIFISIGIACGVGIAAAAGAFSLGAVGCTTALVIAGTIGGLAGATVTAIAVQGVSEAARGRDFAGNKK